MNSILIKNARIIDPSQGWDFLGSLLIEEGVIATLNPDGAVTAKTVIDGSGLVCAPGLVDLHVHLRDPGQTHKEDIASGAAAAAAGGVTTVVAMANTSPVIDSTEALSLGKKARVDAAIRVLQAAAVSRGLGTEDPVDYDGLIKSGAAALSDDGVPVANDVLLEQALLAAKRLRVPLLAHCEDKILAGDGIINAGTISESLGVPGISAESEAFAVKRELSCAERTKAPVHICHVSTRLAVELIREAKAKGVRVTAETAPHYFSLTQELLLSRDADYRMNPPLRTRDDLEAIREALADGTLDCIATDHAPHSPVEKTNFLTAPNGVVGLESSLAVGITYLVNTGVLTLPQLIERMSTIPAKILGIKAGTLKIGSLAELVLFDAEEKWTVDPEKFVSKSKNSSFKGLELCGRVRYTIYHSKIAYKCR